MRHQWFVLGTVPPTDLVKTRLQLHRAVQVPAAVGEVLVPPRPDHSHSSLSWVVADSGMLLSEAAGGAGPVRAGLWPGAQRLVVVRGEPSEVAAEFRLPGETIEAAYTWMDGVLRKEGLLDADASLPRLGLDLGDGPGAGDRRFEGTAPDAFEELARWFGNAALTLAGVREAHVEASAVRCWPHHFDLAVTIPIDAGGGDEERSIGVGMAPGDGSYAEPYWYATPWPYPPSETPLRPLDAGAWHIEGWTGAVLTGSEVVAAGSAGGQWTVVERFLEQAIAGSRAALEGSQSDGRMDG
jgi:hypothetical protein